MLHHGESNNCCIMENLTCLDSAVSVEHQDIYHISFSCNVVRQLRLEKTLPKHEDKMLNSMTQTREKRNPLSLVDLTLKVLWYSVFSFLFFRLEPTVRKDIWIRTNSVTVMVIFRKYHTASYLITAIL